MDPLSHSESRNVIESIGKWIPGFRGYLEREYRRESDALVRKHIENILQQIKSRVDQHARASVDRGELTGLKEADRIKNAVDTLQNRIRSSVRGYSGFFDYVRVQQPELDRVLAVDLALSQRAEELNALSSQLDSESVTYSHIAEGVERLASEFDQRREILEGLRDA